MTALGSFLEALSGRLGSTAQYITVHRIFSCVTLVGPLSHFVDAPFGRFSVQSRLNVNGNIAWFLMEIVSPITFSLTLLGGVLDATPVTVASALSLPQTALTKLYTLSTPTKILASLFLIHYANRSTISSLRTPAKRSPMHISVPISAILFNLCNGYLMGSWLGGRTSPLTSQIGAVPQSELHSKLFWVGIALWALGFVGNLYSDEMLYNLRRPSATEKDKPKPRYSIPHGFLYDWPLGGISFPAYFCEWIEWIGFAVAATAHSPASALPLTTTGGAAGIAGNAAKIAGAIMRSQQALAGRLLQLETYSTPPFLFVWTEFASMLPRALKGHQWYKDKFRSEFPSNRKAVIPGML